MLPWLTFPRQKNEVWQMVSTLYLPREVEVATGEADEPCAVRLRSIWRKVISIQNTWRIDDEWWRGEIARHYFQVELNGGYVVTIFHDLVSGKWYQQRY